MRKKNARTTAVTPHGGSADLIAGLAFMRKNFRNSGISLGDVARFVNRGKSHFCTRFARWYGQPPKALLIELRIEEAKRLMAAGHRIEDVARRCGFCDRSNFTYRFRRVTGTTPARWARSMKGGRRHPNLFTVAEACEYLRLPADGSGQRTLAAYRKKRWLVGHRHVGDEMIYAREDLDACVLHVLGQAQ